MASSQNSPSEDENTPQDGADTTAADSVASAPADPPVEEAAPVESVSEDDKTPGGMTEAEIAEKVQNAQGIPSSVIADHIATELRGSGESPTLAAVEEGNTEAE